MGLYSIELTPADVVTQQVVFQKEFDDLLGCKQLTIFPPFPDYSLLSQNNSPKAVLKAINDVVLSRRPLYDHQFEWLLLPLVQRGRVIGVLFAEGVDRRFDNVENFSLLARIGGLCLERLQWEKHLCREAETMLWRREALMRELSHAIEVAENDGSLTSRRLLSDGPGAAQFTLVCFVVKPAPEVWAGAGPFWTPLAPQVVEALPSASMAAHLGGGYVAIFWPKAHSRDVKLWTERLYDTLVNSDRRLETHSSQWDLAAGIARFPEDFYDDGPFLPWEKSEIGGGPAAAEEVIRRAALAADMARKKKGDKILSYHSLRERGLVPKRESAIEKRLSSFFNDDEDAAFLMVKLDDWKVWQRQHGSREAARRAKKVLELSGGCCPAEATVDWAGPDRIGVFLPGADVDSAQEQGRAIRQRVKLELSTTVQIGLSIHPCPGFAKQDILENARKALVHTGFFGPNTQTLFDAVSLNISGDRLYESGRMEEAVKEFQRALAIDPYNVNVGNSLGVCYAQMGRFQQAFTEFSRVAELDPNDAMTQYNLGCALLSLKQEAEAELAFNRAAELEPENATVYFQLAKLCGQQGRLAESLTHLERTVKLKPNWAQAWRLIGDCFLERGKDDEAMNGFKKALQINGQDAAALSGLAVVYGRTEANLEIALSLARRSVELEPENSLFRQRLAELLMQNQELDEAMAQCQRVATMTPDNEGIRQLQEKISMAQRASTS
ncbi:MAG: tetratricopeptide repeat protein [Deltaproteobacteria bacterium]|nr:MAG: tetratricopeptide repeat protein [Deltaproteobacteria bacterium]